MTHTELVEQAAKWARKKWPVVVTEITTTWGEEPDVICFKTGSSLLIEVKASRGDFLADRNKPFRQPGIWSLGKYRCYFTNPGIAAADEVPLGWGLYEFDGKRVRGVVPIPFKYNSAPGFENEKRHIKLEMGILLSVIRRLGRGVDNATSIKAYTHQTKCRTTVHIDTTKDAHDPA